MGRQHWLGIIAAATALLPGGATAAAQTAKPVDPAGFRFDGPTTRLAAGGFTYYAGDFDAEVPSGADGAVLARTDGTLVPDGVPAVAGGAVVSSAADGSGGAYIAGSFTSVGGTPRKGLAHLRADGTLDPGFDPVGADDYAELRKVVVTGSRVVVMGYFARLGGRTYDASAAVRVAVLDGATGRATAFTAPTGYPFGLLDVAASGDRVYVVRDPTNDPALTALDLTTGALLDWKPALGLDGATGVAVAGGLVVATSGSYGRPFAIAYDPVTGARRWESATKGAGTSGRPLLVPSGNRLYVALRPSDGAAQDPGVVELVALDTASGREAWRGRAALSSLAAGPTEVVDGIVERGGTVYVSGFFRRAQPAGGAASVERHGAAAFDRSSGALTGWQPYIARPAFLDVRSALTLVPFGSGLLLAGDFDAAGPPVGRVHDLARVRADGTLASSFAPGGLRPYTATTEYGTYTSKSVTGVAADGPVLYVSGAFSAISRYERPGIAAIYTPNGGVMPFAPADLTGPQSSVRVIRGRIVVSGSAVYTPAAVRLSAATAFPYVLSDFLLGIHLPQYYREQAYVKVPAAGRVTLELKVGDYIVATGSTYATGPGSVGMLVWTSAAFGFIRSVYPDFAFDGTATFTPADGGPPVVAREKVGPTAP